jgi:hypothetical protein
MALIKHPAKFSDPILDRIGDKLYQYGWPKRILDPFAGTGKVHHLVVEPNYDLPFTPFTVGVEIEADWANLHPRNLIADALALPFPDDTFDGMVTSPCYGSRMADHHNAQDGSIRRSYTHDIGHDLHPHNSGTLQWGDEYRAFHSQAWTESLRVLQPDALIVVNISNHIRGGVEQRVTEWHLQWFLANDCQVVDLDRVNTSRMRFGANRLARARYENVFIVRYQP